MCIRDSSRALAFLYHNKFFDGNALPQDATIVANGETSATDTLNFASVTSLLVSKLPYAQAIASASANTCLNIMAEHVGEKIIWQNIHNPDKYGIYQCNSWAVDATYPDFYNMGLTFVSGNGEFVAAPAPAPELYLIEIWSGADKHYTHDQTTSSDSWVVDHGLGKYPTVQVSTELAGGTSQLGHTNITHNSTNQLTITFSAEYIGKAHCN